MPDITILPLLADYFKVSTDQLLGLKPLDGETYIPETTSTKDFWNRKLEYLLRTRQGCRIPAETMADYLTNYLTLDAEFLRFAADNYKQYDFVLLSNDVKEWSKYLFELRRYQNSCMEGLHCAENCGLTLYDNINPQYLFPLRSSGYYAQLHRSKQS